VTTTDRAAGGGTAIAIAGITEQFELKRAAKFTALFFTASGRRVRSPQMFEPIC
jgi:hypothetical protein